jgi:uncharacterized protein (UPF0264 family)
MATPNSSQTRIPDQGRIGNQHHVSDSHAKTPQLLVSVRSAIEAAVALDGGCEVLDVKDPSRGPLGMADTVTIAAVIEQAQAHAPPVPVSVALGEARDWNSDRPVPPLAPGIAYFKLGTARLARGADAAAQFSSVQRRINVDYSAQFKSQSPSTCGFATPPRWIAVAYADFELACAPAPEEIAGLAATCGSAGILIDTFSKQQKRLLDWLDGDRLAALASLCRSLSLTFALAGRLQAADLPRVLKARPDIVGIRSAACRAGQRNGPIDADALRLFRAALHLAAERNDLSAEFRPAYISHLSTTTG